jgi:F-type H+-transporting ATPase subunit alpha
MIKQPQNDPIDQIDESIMLFAVKEKLIKWIPLDHFDAFKKELISYFKTSPSRKQLINAKAFDDKLSQSFKQEFKKFIKRYVLTIKGYNFNLYGSQSELE